MGKLDERSVLRLLIKHMQHSIQPKMEFWPNYTINLKKVFPREPEIDLIFCNNEDGKKKPPVFAAELKYFRSMNSGRVNISYYSGLDEALALLAYGFDKVILIHIFEETLFSRVSHNYAEVLSGMVTELGLPIGYRTYTLKESDQPQIYYKDTLMGSGYEYNLIDLRREPPKNPLLSISNQIGSLARKNRTLLMGALGIESP